MSGVFVGGNLALDFVATLNERETSRIEQLRTCDDVVGWCVGAGVLDRVVSSTPDDVRRAIEVRECLYELVRALIEQQPVPRSALDVVNTAAAAPPPTVRVGATGHRTRTGDLTAALSAIARDGLDLFDRSDGAVLRWCADPSCTHPFLDRSRGHRRRWCDMGTCGGRAKAAAYRRRRSAD